MKPRGRLIMLKNLPTTLRYTAPEIYLVLGADPEVEEGGGGGGGGGTHRVHGYVFRTYINNAQRSRGLWGHAPTGNF